MSIVDKIPQDGSSNTIGNIPHHNNLTVPKTPEEIEAKNILTLDFNVFQPI